MGTTLSKQSMKSVEGLDRCPSVGIFHNHTDHEPAVTRCDGCHIIKMCKIWCESPKSSQLHRRCHSCEENWNQQSFDELKDSSFSIK